jgi:hypothetical protein
MLALTYPLVEGHERGWPASSVVMLAATAPTVGVFVAWQRYRRRSGHAPVIDFELFRSRAFALGVAVTVCQFVAFAGLQFVLAVYLQTGLGGSALAAGLALAPFAAGTFTGSLLSHRATRLLGGKVLPAGAALLTLGVAGLLPVLHLADSWQGVVPTAWLLALPTFTAGVGAMSLGAPLLAVALDDVPSGDAGSAGGILATGQRIGHALGVAVTGSTLFAVLPAGARTATPGTFADRYTDSMLLAVTSCLIFALVTVALTVMLARVGRVRSLGLAG